MNEGAIEVHELFIIVLSLLLFLHNRIGTLLYSTALFNSSMPKVVDNYVFERKIGSGQYGDVFKGYNKQDNSDIAIKAIKR